MKFELLCEIPEIYIHIRDYNKCMLYFTWQISNRLRAIQFISIHKSMLAFTASETTINDSESLKPRHAIRD